jgi:hypothetical protein
MVDIEEVLPRLILTPAERAVLVEQANTINAMIAEFTKACELDTGEAVGRAYLELARHAEYIGNLVTTKLQHTAIQIETERRQ